MRPFIGTRKTQLRTQGDDANRTWINQRLVGLGHRTIKDWTPKGTVEARVYNGNWIADCPAGCGGADFVDHEWPVYVCTDCGEGPRKVVFPQNRVAIEEVLIARPLDKNRHWFTHETVKDLQAENKERL